MVQPLRMLASLTEDLTSIPGSHLGSSRSRGCSPTWNSPASSGSETGELQRDTGGGGRCAHFLGGTPREDSYLLLWSANP